MKSFTRQSTGEPKELGYFGSAHSEPAGEESLLYANFQKTICVHNAGNCHIGGWGFGYSGGDGGGEFEG